MTAMESATCWDYWVNLYGIDVNIQMVTRVATTVWLLLLSLLPTAAPQAEAEVPLPERFVQLDQRFRELSVDLYDNYLGPEGEQLAPISGPMQLETLGGPMRLEIDVRKYLERGDEINAIATVIQNSELVLKKMRGGAMMDFIELMLEHNEWRMANELYDHIKRTGLKFQTINTAYVFAKFHFRRHEWQSCLEALRLISDEKVSALHMDYFNLMYGVSLQQLGRYEEAIEYFNLITPTSEYRQYGALNKSASQLGLEADVQRVRALQAHLNEESLPVPAEVRDYFSLMVGNHFLEQEQYAEARGAFGRISVESRYFNRALLGVAYAALKTEEYGRALKFASQLRNKSSTDIAVDESYLLMAHILEKSQRTKKAADAYKEAVTYYSSRIRHIDHFLNARLNQELVFNLISDIDLLHEYPGSRSLFDNMKGLGAFQKQLNLFDRTLGFEQRVQELYHDYTVLIEAMVRQSLESRRHHLESYLGQSRFGLVTLYDKGESK